jgi:hypothetical protein
MGPPQHAAAPAHSSTALLPIPDLGQASRKPVFFMPARHQKGLSPRGAHGARPAAAAWAPSPSTRVGAGPPLVAVSKQFQAVPGRNDPPGRGARGQVRGCRWRAWTLRTSPPARLPTRLQPLQPSPPLLLSGSLGPIAQASHSVAQVQASPPWTGATPSSEACCLYRPSIPSHCPEHHRHQLQGHRSHQWAVWRQHAQAYSRTEPANHPHPCTVRFRPCVWACEGLPWGKPAPWCMQPVGPSPQFC